MVQRTGRDDPAHRKGSQFQIAHAVAVDHVGLEHDIQIALEQLLVEVACGVGRQLDLHRGVALHHPCYERTQPGVNDGIHSPDANTPLNVAGIANRLLQGLHGVDHALGIFEHLLPFRGQRYALGITQEKTRAEFILERSDTAGNGRLGAEQLLGCQAEALEPCHPDEGLEKSQIHAVTPLRNVLLRG